MHVNVLFPVLMLGVPSGLDPRQGRIDPVHWPAIAARMSDVEARTEGIDAPGSRQIDWRRDVITALKDSTATAKSLALVSYSGPITPDDRAHIAGYGTIENVEVVGVNGILVSFVVSKLRELAGAYTGSRIVGVKLATERGMSEKRDGG